MVASFDLSPYHIAIHEKSKNDLNVHNFEQVKLRIIKTNPCTIKTLKCSIVTETETTPDMSINKDSIQHAFENWSISGEMQKPLSFVNNASFVVLSGEDNTHNASIQCILEVEFVENFTRTDEAEGPVAATMANHETQKKRVKFPYYALIGGTRENVPFITDFRRSLPTKSKLLLSKNDQPSSKWKESVDEKEEERKLSPLSFSDSFDSILAPLQANISSLVKRKEAAARFTMATPIPGATLIHGPRGSGKSSILRHMCTKFGQDKDSLAFVVWIDCRKLRGLKMAHVQEHFEQKFQQALSHAPSVRILC